MSAHQHTKTSGPTTTIKIAQETANRGGVRLRLLCRTPNDCAGETSPPHPGDCSPRCRIHRRVRSVGIRCRRGPKPLRLVQFQGSIQGMPPFGRTLKVSSPISCAAPVQPVRPGSHGLLYLSGAPHLAPSCARRGSVASRTCAQSRAVSVQHPSTHQITCCAWDAGGAPHAAGQRHPEHGAARAARRVQDSGRRTGERQTQPKQTCGGG